MLCFFCGSCSKNLEPLLGPDDMGVRGTMPGHGGSFQTQGPY